VDFHAPGVTHVGGYSICSTPRDLQSLGLFELCVKASRHPCAQWVHQQAVPGDKVCSLADHGQKCMWHTRLFRGRPRQGDGAHHCRFGYNLVMESCWYHSLCASVSLTVCTCIWLSVQVGVEVGGSFTLSPSSTTRPTLFVAGGIGITCLSSMLGHLVELEQTGGHGLEQEAGQELQQQGGQGQGERGAQVPPPLLMFSGVLQQRQLTDAVCAGQGGC
jgi:hypothetical protein